jgi:hypothetical protein
LTLGVEARTQLMNFAAQALHRLLRMIFDCGVVTAIWK